MDFGMLSLKPKLRRLLSIFNLVCKSDSHIRNLLLSPLPSSRRPAGCSRRIGRQSRSRGTPDFCTFCPCIFCIQEHKADIEEELLGGQALLRLLGLPRLPRPAQELAPL